MPVRSLALPCILLLWAAVAPAQPAPARPSAPPGRGDAAPAIAPAPPRPRTPVYIGGVYDTGQFLPDTAVLARVGDRVLRIERFVDAYFASYPPVRPRPDSLGRVEFLNSMINKEIMALTALEVNRPLGFEDRLQLRGHTERTLANVLYRRAVLDSVSVSEEDVQRTYAEFSYEARFRRIPFADPNDAEAIRRLIVSGKLKWNDAVKRYAPGSPSPDGDMGWVSRGSLDMETALQVWELKPGEVSRVVRDPEGFHLMQMVERRRVVPVAIEPLRLILTNQIRAQRAARRADHLQAQVAARIGVVYDTTNILWAAAQLRGHETLSQGPEGPVLNLGAHLHDFQDADTARTLVTHRHGRFSLGQFLEMYHALPPLLRRPVGDFESLRAQLDATVLEPYMAEEARARGLDRDSLAVYEIEKKREEILVEHLFQDSIQSRVWIPPADRRKYYDEHSAQFITYDRVRFAAIVRDTKAGADSVVARIKAGEKAADILHADSLRGVTSGSIQERSDNDRGPHHSILFGDLRPGQSTVVGPDREGTWMVLHLLEFNQGRLLPYEQVQHLVDDALQNQVAERMLLDFIARHRRRYRIEAHPELVMRIRLVDPAGK